MIADGRDNLRSTIPITSRSDGGDYEFGISIQNSRGNRHRSSIAPDYYNDDRSASPFSSSKESPSFVSSSSSLSSSLKNQSIFRAPLISPKMYAEREGPPPPGFTVRFKDVYYL